MEKSILIGGGAGQGIAKTSELLGKTLARLGYFVFNYRDYASLIRGGHNFNVLKISDQPVYSHETRFDVIVALDQDTVEKHEKELKEGGYTLGDKSLTAKNLVGIDVQAILQALKAPQIAANSVLLGTLFKCLELPLPPLLSLTEEEFGEKAGIVKQTIEQGYERALTKTRIESQKKEGFYFLTGNEAVASGALAAGLDLYIGYPMTPATPVLHFLAAKQKEYQIKVLQLENEIAVVNSALGASYAGAVAMVGTSGGGFALMTEALSLQGMSEVPLVVYLAQRTAPSTGVPTYSSQGDLKFAVNAGHGEFPRVVVAPGDSQDAFLRTIEAFYLAYKYHVLSIIVGDKHLGESHYTFAEFASPRVETSRFISENPGSEYKRYQLTESGVSPRAVPGEGPFVQTTSYEHDEHGYTTEDPQWVIKMNNKRMKKVVGLREEIDRLNPITVFGEGENLIVGWGSTKGATLDALKHLPNFRFLQISYITPFPQKQVKKELENSQNVFLVENNVTGLLGDIIAEQTGYLIKNKVLKYDSRPFTANDVIKGIEKFSKSAFVPT